MRHNPYFSRWFSAINEIEKLKTIILGHNPYFSRWFSAMAQLAKQVINYGQSQSLFQQMVFCNTIMTHLREGEIRSQSLFQQMVFCNKEDVLPHIAKRRHNPYFSRWFSAIFEYPINYTSNEESQSLFQQMVFCNQYHQYEFNVKDGVTILILVDGFLQWASRYSKCSGGEKSQSLFQQMVFCNRNNEGL